MGNGQTARSNWTRSVNLTRTYQHMADDAVRKRVTDPEPLYWRDAQIAAAPAAGTGAGGIDVAHGWTLAQVTAAARMSAHIAYASGIKQGIADSEDVALSGIGLLLAASHERPTFQDLVHAGRAAIWSDNAQTVQMRGLKRTVAERQRGEDPHRPGFAFYWRMWHQGFSSPEEHAMHIAWEQVMDALDPLHREALLALAVHGTKREAAAALGIQVQSLRLRLKKAVPAFQALWWQHEAPPPIAPRHGDRQAGTCRYGHPAEWNGRYMACRRCSRSQDLRSRRKSEGRWL